MESLESVMLFFQAAEGETEAHLIGPRTRKGMIQETRTEMVDGVAYVGSTCPLPPGMARLRLRQKAGTGASVLVFDSPAHLPDPGVVAYGMPEVRTPTGHRVDQVANVRWALSVLGTKGKANIGRELIRRQFSTAGARQLQGPATVVNYPDTAVNAIVRHLEFYETGTLTVRLGGECADIEVLGCTPPDGPWATPQRFKEIAGWRARCAELEAIRGETTLGGLPVTANGVASVLVAYKRGTALRGEAAFRVARSDAVYNTRAAVPGLILTHEHLADAIVDGLQKAGAEALHLVPVSAPVPADLEARDHTLRVHRESVAASMSSVAEQLDERDGNGARIISGALLTEKNAEYNRLAEELALVDRGLAEVATEITVADQAHRAREAPALAEELLSMISTLRDPYALTHRYMWRSAIRNVSVTMRRRRVAQLRGETITVSGEIWVGGDGAQVVIPFERTIDTLQPVIDQRVEALIAAMRTGTSLRDAKVPLARHFGSIVAAELGLSSRHFGLSQCDDPRILRIAMARCHPVPGGADTDEAVAAEFGEPIALVRRIGELWGQDAPCQWRLPGAPIVVALHVAAATGRGTARREQIVGPVAHSHDAVWNSLRGRGLSDLWRYQRGGTWTLSPCPRCGSFALAPCLIREIDTYLCLSCWTDRSGVSWPAHPYAHLIDGIASWQAAGIVPGHLPERPYRAQSPRTRQRRHPGRHEVRDAPLA